MTDGGAVVSQPESEGSGLRQSRANEFRSGPEGESGEIYGEDHLLLPGKGESGPRCGQCVPHAVCDGEIREGGDETHVVFGECRCGRRECPDCWSSEWAGPRTVSVVSRLGAARYAADEDIDKRAVHAVFSPPAGEIESKTALYERRQEVADLAKEHGVRGGVPIPHPYRLTDEAITAFESQDEYKTRWVFARDNDKPWREQVYWSPHYHVVGLCRDFQPSDPEGDDGWVSKNVEHGGSHSLAPFSLTDSEGYDDMAGIVRYLLSHAAFPEDEARQVVTWFGELHGTNFDPERELSQETWQTIQRMAEEVVGSPNDDSGDSGADEGDADDCPVEGCPGNQVHIWDAMDFLDRHRSDLSARAAKKIKWAYWWWDGDIKPPPGLKRPETRDDAREAFEVMLGGDYQCPL